MIETNSKLGCKVLDIITPKNGQQWDPTLLHSNGIVQGKLRYELSLKQHITIKRDGDDVGNRSLAGSGFVIILGVDATGPEHVF